MQSICVISWHLFCVLVPNFPRWLGFYKHQFYKVKLSFNFSTSMSSCPVHSNVFSCIFLSIVSLPTENETQENWKPVQNERLSFRPYTLYFTLAITCSAFCALKYKVRLIARICYSGGGGGGGGCTLELWVWNHNGEHHRRAQAHKGLCGYSPAWNFEKVGCLRQHSMCLKVVQ